MGKLAGFRYRDVVKRSRRLGFQFHRQGAGSHEIWMSAATGRYVLIANHAGDIAEGTVRAILGQAGVSIEDFLA